MHWMDEHVDTGPIAYAAAFPVEHVETGLSLSTRCAREGLELLRPLLRDAAEGTIPSTPHDLSARRYFHRGPPSDGFVDWRRPAAAIERFVRACDYSPQPSPWAPAPRATLDGVELRLLRVRPAGPSDAEPGAVAVEGDVARASAADAWLEVEYVEIDDRTMHAAEVLLDGAMFDHRA